MESEASHGPGRAGRRPDVESEFEPQLCPSAQALPQQSDLWFPVGVLLTGLQGPALTALSDPRQQEVSPTLQAQLNK